MQLEPTGKRSCSIDKLGSWSKTQRIFLCYYEVDQEPAERQARNPKSKKIGRMLRPLSLVSSIFTTV